MLHFVLLFVLLFVLHFVLLFVLHFVLFPSAAGCLLGRLSRERLHRPLSSIGIFLDMRVETPRLNVITSPLSPTQC